jgi:hypothetical protein
LAAGVFPTAASPAAFRAGGLFAEASPATALRPVVCAAFTFVVAAFRAGGLFACASSADAAPAAVPRAVALSAGSSLAVAFLTDVFLADVFFTGDVAGDPVSTVTPS